MYDVPGTTGIFFRHWWGKGWKVIKTIVKMAKPWFVQAITGVEDSHKLSVSESVSQSVSQSVSD